MIKFIRKGSQIDRRKIALLTTKPGKMNYNLIIKL